MNPIVTHTHTHENARVWSMEMRQATRTLSRANILTYFSRANIPYISHAYVNGIWFPGPAFFLELIQL